VILIGTNNCTQFSTGHYPYKGSGYMSEPEPNYDSDYLYKYSTLDRRRTGGVQTQYEEK
jgi:hypothetical protein